jgi:hypothetical protein
MREEKERGVAKVGRIGENGKRRKKPIILRPSFVPFSMESIYNEII